MEYDGSAFNGWQRLAKPGQAESAASVQSALENALSFVADTQIETVCAGRTDAGVHAQCQVAHFDSSAPRTTRAWILGTNTRLPPSVSVRWCSPVPSEFHARFSAEARRYCYRILNRSVRPALQRHYVTWVRELLDAEAMHAAAQLLLGENDFSSFRSAQCEATHARRELQAISVIRDGDWINVNVQANAFLHHMVRNIVGSLRLVGSGERPTHWIGEVLRARNRNLAGPTAPASGLTFLGPLYPPAWQLPKEVTR